MTGKLSVAMKSAALAGALGLAGLAASTTAASAHYRTTRCYGDHCRVLRCDNDGDDCYAIRSYWRGDYDRGWHRAYWRHHRRWVCDDDGDRCHWQYGRHYRPHLGISFGWHD